MSLLIDFTNATGYVTFQNVKAGAYTFKLIKQGYEPLNATVDFTGQTMPITLMLFRNITTTDNTSIIVIIAVVIASVVIAAIIILLVKRRGKSSRKRKLQELQKKLANPMSNVQ